MGSLCAFASFCPFLFVLPFHSGVGFDGLGLVLVHVGDFRWSWGRKGGVWGLEQGGYCGICNSWSGGVSIIGEVKELRR